MRILIAGDWHSYLHEEAVFDAFGKLGNDVHRFAWHTYFKSPQLPAPLATLDASVRKAQNKFLIGPLLTRLNRDLIEAARRLRPDMIFVYRGTHVTANALRAIKRHLPETVVIGYNNDDPFGQGHPPWLWRHFVAALPAYDLVLAYRRHNLEDFKQHGAGRVELLRSWYLPALNRPVELNPEEQVCFGCDVAFIGHFEPDGRLNALESVVKAGFDFKLFGPEWNGVAEASPTLMHLAPIEPVRGESYNKAICGTKIALCFLSKLNRDTYTRRCFEIPAAGTMLLSEYSDDLASLFAPGVDADFFRTPDELVEKLRYYLGNDEERRKVAASGHHRVATDGHDVVSRMEQVLSWVKSIRETMKAENVASRA